jgi:tetratricopeptide (TPR) repeat protein
VPSPSPARRLLAASVLASGTALVGVLAATHGRWIADPPSGVVCGPAHHDIQLGRFFLDKFSTEGMTTAVRHFEAALTRVPDCAPAYAGLAEAYNQQASVFLSLQRPREVRRLAIVAATRAVQLDPTLAEAHAALGYATMHDMDWQRAGVALRRAIALNPRYVIAHEIYAAYLADQRQFRQAIAEARLGVDLASASERARRTLAWMLYFARDYEAALRELDTVVQMDPGNASGHFRLGALLLVMGRPSEAVPALERAVDLGHRGPAALGLLGMGYGSSGRHADAQRVLGELEARAETRYVAPGALLLAYLGVGDKTRAVDMVVRGYEERDNYEINIVVDPLMDPLRGDRRFEEMCRKVMLGSALDPNMRARSESIADR